VSILLSIIVPTVRDYRPCLLRLSTSLVFRPELFEIIIVVDTINGGYIQDLEWPSEISLVIVTTGSSTLGGPGYARNAGIEWASGTYITFVDDDDSISINPDLIYLLSQDYDLVIGRFMHSNQDYSRHIVDNHEVATSEFQSTLLRDNRLLNHCTGLVFSSRLLIENRILFPETIIVEDIAFVTCVLCFSSKLLLSHSLTYSYTSSSGTTKNSPSLTTINDILSVISYVDSLRPDSTTNASYIMAVRRFLLLVYHSRLFLISSVPHRAKILFVPQMLWSFIELLVSHFKQGTINISSLNNILKATRDHRRSIESVRNCVDCTDERVFIYCDGVLACAIRSILAQCSKKRSMIAIVDDNPNGKSVISHHKFIRMLQLSPEVKTCLIIANLSSSTCQRIYDSIRLPFPDKTKLTIIPLTSLLG